MTVIQAEGPLLERVRNARWRSLNEGLSQKAYGLWHIGQLKSSAAHGSQRCFALVDGLAIRASAERYDLIASLDGRRIQVCGLAAVLSETAGDVASADRLVDALLAAGKADGAELALLFPRGDRLTTKPGDCVIRPVDLTLRVTESTRYGAPMTNVRGGEERDMVAIAAMGSRRATPFRFHLERDAGFVQQVITRKRLLGGLGPVNARQLHFFIAEEGITAAAYVVVSVVGAEWTLEECGDRDPSGARVGALLQALIAREPIERRPVIRGWLPAGFLPPQVTVVSSTPSTNVIVIRPLGSALPRALDAAAVLYWRNDCF